MPAIRPEDVPPDKVEKYVNATVAAKILEAFIADMEDKEEFASFVSSVQYGLMLALEFPELGREMSRLLDQMAAMLNEDEPGSLAEYQREFDDFRKANTEALEIVRKEITEAHERLYGPPLPGS